ncbi:probable ribosome biogenesis protein RLP24 [Tanacetum coccineum]|uniref:Probable ribosome biogenesis protein RLP24 n=1 Tax=Tanacetum coccineum TaxID=301880 RepID=A0ABQ4WLH3_9ASTR
MKRNPRKERWTKAYRRLHDKDMTQTLANTRISPLPHAQNIDANKSVRRRHIVDRARISVAAHGQPDSVCDEGWHLSFVASTKLISRTVLKFEKLLLPDLINKQRLNIITKGNIALGNDVEFVIYDRRGSLAKGQAEMGGFGV